MGFIKISFLICLSAILTTVTAHAQSTVLAVGSAKAKQSVIAMISPVGSGAMEAAYGTSIQNTIESDLIFFNLFKLYPESEFAQKSVSDATQVIPELWLKKQVDYLTYAQLKTLPGSKLKVDFHVYSVAGGKEILTQSYEAEHTDLKSLSHAMADDLVFAVTGKKGLFRTRIAMVCDRGGKKEIWSMNFDGSDLRQITKLNSLAMAPAWTPDGTKLAFSVYTKHSNGTKNLDLFQHDFRSGKIELLSNKSGINSGAAFHPNGRDLALTLSFTGNPEIFLLNTQTKQATQLTRSLGFDVDPRFSPDGSKIAFVSSRPGKPMIYVMPTDKPETAKRITYAGQYNATPSWTPDGKKIAFAGWIEKHFDLFVINIDTQQIDRLTKSEGNNEDPSVSPDGNYIAFTSNREAGKNIWIMGLDGKFLKRLTFAAGNCSAPQWSPYLK